MYKFIVTDNFDNSMYFKSKTELENALANDLTNQLEFEDENELSIYELGKQHKVVKSMKVIPV